MSKRAMGTGWGVSRFNRNTVNFMPVEVTPDISDLATCNERRPMLIGNHRTYSFALATIFVICRAANVGAAPLPVFALTASPSSVAPGDVLTVELELTGLAPGEELDSLAATIHYDDTLFGPPSIALGGILPNPLDDPFDVLIIEDAGLADVSFLTLGLASTSHIQANGLFFSFNVAALRPGNAKFSFEFADATEFNSGDPGSPIPVSLSSNGDSFVTVIPEPSGIAIVLLTLFSVLFCNCRKTVRL